MPFTIAGENLILAGTWDPASQVTSLHTGAPGETGINEVTGGTPAYARKAIAWDAPTGGNMDSSNQPVFDVPAVTVTHVGLWQGGTFCAWSTVTPNLVFAAQGTARLADADVTTP